MKDERKFSRFIMPLLKAQYFLEDKGGKWEKCTVMNMIRIGVGVKFHKRKKINIGSTVYLEVFLPKEPEVVSVKGVLKWFALVGDDSFLGGIEFSEALEEDKFAGLCSIYAGEHIAE